MDKKDLELIKPLYHQFHLPIEKFQEISEGFIYSTKEQQIHGFKVHGGIDYSANRDTPVYAAHSGFAFSSYHTFLVKDENGKAKLYKDKEVFMGLGLFVMIYHPDLSKKLGHPIYTEYAHLESVVKNIPFFPPYRYNEGYHPRGHKLDPELLELQGIKIKSGDALGTVGDSGLCWGYEDYPRRPDCDKCPSWDETHLHFAVFTRIGAKKEKKYLDPYGIYASHTAYTKTNSKETKHPSLWKQ